MLLEVLSMGGGPVFCVGGEVNRSAEISASVCAHDRGFPDSKRGEGECAVCGAAFSVWTGVMKSTEPSTSVCVAARGSLD